MFVWVAILTLSFQLVCVYSANPENCNCGRTICPSTNNCLQNRILDDCGCCFVCARNVGEVCGGKRNSFGKCGVGLKCDFGENNPGSYLKIGFCEKNLLVRKASSRPTPKPCDVSKETYIERQIGGSTWNRACYQQSCDKVTRLQLIPKNCLDIGCGVSRPLRSICCRICRREKPQVSCKLNSILVTVPKSIMPRNVFLNASLMDTKCKGFESKRHFYFETSLYGCGTVMKSEKNVHKYFNAIRVTLGSKTTPRNYTFYKFFCAFKRSTTATAMYRIRQNIVISGGVRMNFASRGGRLYYKKKGRLVNKAERLDVSISNSLARKYKIRMVVNQCYLTSRKSTGKQNGWKHVLIQQGCIVDNRVKVKFKRRHTIWFSFTTKDIVNKFGRINLHCDVIICPLLAVKGRCSKDCVKKLPENGNIQQGTSL
eukprot:Seg1962.2 transcript_id=Seg1962.2/GoldUCD/mRNA.D3Y31 product="Venom protein 302" protein_id=Seg1962.2/GoldUCD/D3Y31